MPADAKVEAQLQIAAKYLDLGQWSEAETVCHALLDEFPTQHDALYILALAELGLGRPQESRVHLAASVALEPRPEPLSDLGNLLAEEGRLDEAIDCFHRALEMKPDYAIALNNLGDALQMKGLPDEALTVLKQAVAHAPDLPEIHNNLGVVLRDTEQLDAAEKSLAEAIRLRPKFAEAWSNLGNIAAMRGDNQQARLHYEKSLAIRPNDALRLRMATLMPGIPRSREETQITRERFRNDVRQLAEENIQIADPLKDVGTTPFYLAYQGQDDRADLEMLASLYRRACPTLSFTASHCGPPYRGTEGRRIKIGFLSSLFYYHTIGRLMEGLIRLLPRDQFEVHLFTSGPRTDDTSNSIAAHAEGYWHVPRSLPDAHGVIAAAELDILVHAGVGLDSFSYFLAFARLAPVQCVTWGHPVTSGLDTMDYYISCAEAEIDEADAHYTETLVRLRHYTTYYRRPALGEGTWTRGMFGLPDIGALYLCAQSLFKFDAGFDDFINGILCEDRTGFFVMIEGQRPEHTRLVKERFARSIGGVADRLRFIPRQSVADFLGLIALADVVVDTPLFCGGLSSMEALALGTPVVTLPSEFRRGRLTHAMYRQMGVTDCIAPNREGYVALATRLGRDPEFRRETAEKILTRVDTLFENQTVIAEHAAFFTRAVRDAVQ